MQKKIILVTGGFDPIHHGHVAYFEAARALGDMLVVGVNSDAWLTRKKGRPFMNWADRAAVVRSMRVVDQVIEFDDSDGSARNAIKRVRQLYPDSQLVFANGGDRTSSNIPEMDIIDDNLEFAFGVGGEDKKNSSSWILEEWRAPKTERVWGYYRVLHEYGQRVKLKELTVNPGNKLSMQRHQQRSEFWFVVSGVATVYTQGKNGTIKTGEFTKSQHLWIPVTEWHQLANETTEPLQIVEIQYGSDCKEEDIERIS
jgi:D-beta-D-heptose 7-phosphate kinase/D-beta-D-heptose 1-phosphate adenosyltransferase